MDERAINGAAIEAIRDLELDCEIKEVCQRSGGEEWCIQFSGKYGQFCDKFKNQFDEESSPQVIREKIKSHLIKQVNKIRSSTGRKRKSAINEGSESRSSEGGILSTPLKMIGEAFDRVTGIAGGVINQASTVAETARDVVSDVAANISPITVEVRSTTRTSAKSASRSTAKKKPAKPAKSKAAKAKKATRRVARGASKQAKKTAKKIATKSSRRAR